MIRIAAIVIVAAVAAFAVAPSGFAQTFSHTSGTGNVLPSHYDEHGNLVPDYVSKNGAMAPMMGGHSAFAADRAKSAPAVAPGRRAKHH